MKVGILKEFMGNEKYVENACIELGIDYVTIDFLSENWLEEVKESNCDAFMYRPSNLLSHWRDLFVERIYVLEKVMNLLVYPKFNEIHFYENKRLLAYYLQAYSIPHPKTYVIYDKNEGKELAKSFDYPVVNKTNIGSGGSGVVKIKGQYSYKRYLRKVFPFMKIGFGGLTRYNTLKHKYNIPVSVPILSDRQKGYVITQECVDIVYEWRMIKIGDSYFGHQKLEKNGSHSGSGLVGWVDVPRDLLEFVKDIAIKMDHNCMAYDIFETKDGKYLVNEMQTAFGGYNPSQMYINEEPYRYLFKDGEWILEKGLFNQNSSYNLRLLDLKRILSEESITNNF
ncbi:ATP-grasp domain-containing protein [Ancylomarina longa]|uniref:ATP-grasp domain-containing protein n=1 Tax=Ancylomarina longa TaxID=2487017 RepID=A0A434AZT4_9BACT|nr:hypothetical protein [Ancylomarina longa]RUT80128.1 hypothetical protein DLK05_01865 [Ancylomarina longa]